MKGTLPMLLADLSDEIGALSSRIQSSLSIEVVHGAEQNLYLFRLQVGATLVCWLADPNDPEIHSLLETWVSAGHLFFGLRTNQGVIVQTRPVGGVPPSIDEITSASGGMDTGRFLRSTAAVVNSGRIKAQAQSDISSVPKIRKVRAFLVLGKNENMGVRDAPTS